MQIHRLEVKNFRCFEGAAWEFGPRFNLLVGDNGSGKTAIMEAVVIALQPVLEGEYLERQYVGRHNPEVRRSTEWLGETRTIRAHYPMVVSCTSELRSEFATWEVAQVYAGAAQFDWPSNSHTWQRLKSLRDEGSLGRDEQLPLSLHFPCERLSPESVDAPLTMSESRLAGYQSWRNSPLALTAMLEWFRDMEGRALQTDTTLHTLEGVKRAVLRCVPGSQSIRYDFTEKDLVVTRKDGRALPLGLQSHGYRTVIGMAANIAYRCAVLNPQLMGVAPEQTEGIVLIDEIDLHLHPKWQRSVVESLCAAFPKLQFIATTHSPFIIQSLDPDRGDRLINLDNPAADDVENKSIEEIAEENQGVEGVQRSQRFQEMVAAAEEYYRVLQQAEQALPGEIERLKQRLDTLTEPYSEDPAYVAFLRMERAAAGIDGKKNGHAAG